MAPKILFALITSLLFIQPIHAADKSIACNIDQLYFSLGEHLSITFSESCMRNMCLHSKYKPVELQSKEFEDKLAGQIRLGTYDKFNKFFTFERWENAGGWVSSNHFIDDCDKGHGQGTRVYKLKADQKN